jgi:hypothetical protein
MCLGLVKLAEESRCSSKSQVLRRVGEIGLANPRLLIPDLSTANSARSHAK